MNKNWSNTALVAYSLLPKIAKQLDNAILNRIRAGFQSKHLQSGVSTQRLLNEIIELTEEKRKIVNLRYIVNNALKQLDDEEKSILNERINDKKTYKEIAKEYGIALRTAFRRVDIAENHFAKALKNDGYGESWLAKEYSNDKYIYSIYKRIENEKYFVAKSL